MKISENIVDFIKYKKNKHNKKTRPLIIFAFIFLLIFLLFVFQNLLEVIIGKHIEKTNISIETEADISFDINAYDNSVAVLSSQGFKKYDEQGNEQWRNFVKFQNPVLYKAGNYVLQTDKGGREVYLIYKDTVKYNFKTNESIQFAAVNSSGCFAIATNESGYKSLITVYNNKGEELFKWYSAENYVVDVDISPNNKAVAISTFVSSQNEVTSNLLVFDMNSEVPVSKNLYEENLIFDVEFLKNNTIVALGDKKAVCIKKNGEKKWEIEYNGRQIHTYYIAKSNIVLAMSQMSDIGVVGSGSEINIYNSKGKQTGKFNAEGKIISIDHANKRIVFNTRNGIFLISDRGKKIAKGEIIKDIKQLKFLNNKNKIMAITGTSIDIFKVKMGR